MSLTAILVVLALAHVATLLLIVDLYSRIIAHRSWLAEIDRAELLRDRGLL